jgi:hypothetical protein
MSLPLYRVAASGRLHRRDFLIVTGSLSAAAVWSSRATGALVSEPKFSSYPFTLGVASGEPDASGQWLADLAPVSGPILGPFAQRSEALAAESDWLARHWLCA